MKPNPLLVAAAVLALLGGAVWYTRENPPTDDDAVAKIVDLDGDDLQGITVRRPDEDAIEMVRGEDGEWEFGGGLAISADDSSIGTLASSLASLNAERVVSEAVVEWQPYGLDEPSLAVEFELEEGGGEVLFGRDSPTGSAVFARLQGDPRLFTVYSYNKTSFDKSVFDLRDKHLLKLDEDTMDEIRLRTPSRSIRFAREDGDWRIAEPIETRADGFTVSDLARALRSAEMTEVLAEEADSRQFPFNSPIATVTATDASGSHELVVAKKVVSVPAAGDGLEPREDITYYARSSSLEGVYEVGSTLALGFDKDLADFRDMKLFGFGYDDPARVEVRAGEDAVAIVRSDGQWQLESDGGRELEGEAVQTLLDRLRALTATEVLSDSAAAQSRYGLGSPGVEASVTPDGEGDESERVRLTSPGQAPVYAAREGEPSTFEVERAAAENIVRSVEEILRPPEEDGESEAGTDSGEGSGAEPRG